MPKLVLAVLLAAAGAPATDKLVGDPASRPDSQSVLTRQDMKDFPLSAETTYDEVVGRWGAPAPYGPAQALLTYPLDSGEQLWLSFEPDSPRRLARAILLKSSFTGEAVELFNALELTKHRRREQLDFSKGASDIDVDAAWGPPDALSGSGVPTWHYRLSNGETALMSFSGPRAMYVRFEPQRP